MVPDDITQPETTTAPAAAAPKAPRPKKRKTRRQAKPAARSAAIVAPKRPSSDGLPKSAVYGILIVLVVAASFASGYMLGRNGAPGGNAMTGKLTILEYSDYQCPFCKRYFQETEGQLKAAYGDKIEIVFKNFPLESIHQNALQSAIAAECVRKIGGEKAFWTYHDTLFTKGNADGTGLEIANLKAYAHDQGLGSDFDSCLDNKETESVVRADIADGTAKGVRGTPSFWVKDELVVGALPFASFKTTIDQKLAGVPAAPAAPPAPEPDQPTGPVDVATGAHAMGDANAPVTIVEFSDFQCPFCKNFFTATEAQIVDTYVKTGKVRFAYRHFPLSFHQNAEKSAEASECAADQGKFWEYHDVLFTKGNGDGTGLEVADLKQYAADLKLNTATFNACLDGGSKAALVQADFAAGSAAGVSGTPSFYVNGNQIVGAQPFASFKAAIDAELAQ